MKKSRKKQKKKEKKKSEKKESQADLRGDGISTIDRYYTVEPLYHEHQRDRTKCPLYRGVLITEVGNV